jgi:hypothetical protein
MRVFLCGFCVVNRGEFVVSCGGFCGGFAGAKNTPTFLALFLGWDGSALVEGDLPSAVEEGPEGAAKGLAGDLAGGVSTGDFVGGEDGGGGDLTGGEVFEDGGWAGWFVFEDFEDGAFVEGAAGGAELDEVVGEHGGDSFRVAADGWVEELLFEVFDEMSGGVHSYCFKATCSGGDCSVDGDGVKDRGR